MDEIEEKRLKELLALEDLAEKKAKIYSRLLIDVQKAQDMARLSARHAARKAEIEKLLFGDKKKVK